MSKTKKVNKRLIALTLVIVFTAALALGLWLFIQYRNDKRTVGVVPVSQVADYYWGDQSSSSGILSSDFVQELYADTGKVISEIFVEEGQEVQIGDPLLQYDKTQLELEREVKRIAVEKAALNLQNAQRQLEKLQNTKPTTTPGTITPTAKPPVVQPTVRPSTTPTPVPPADVTLYSRLDLHSVPYAGKGTSEEPYVFLCTPDCTMSQDFLRRLLGMELEAQPTLTPEPEEEEPVESEPEDTDSEPEDSELSPSPSPSPSPSTALITPFAAIFEVRDGNSNYGKLISAFRLDGNKLSANFAISSTLSGSSTLESIASLFGATPNPNNYNDMGYTANELKELISEKKEEIQRLQLARRQADLDLTVADLQLRNSTVLSTINGTVRTLIDQETALAEGRPFLVVSGDSTYYVTGAISEAALPNIQVGATVTVTDYMNGGSYSADIVSISDYPLDQDSNLYYYGSGNPNSSNYEFTAVIAGADEGLQSGQYVDIDLTVQNEEAANALYIQNAYIREDDSGSYVMKVLPDNRLKKQYVRTGRSLYGYSTEIRTGLTAEDYIAFPYGPDVQEGVRAVLEGTEDPPYASGEEDLPNISVGDSQPEGGVTFD